MSDRRNLIIAAVVILIVIIIVAGFALVVLLTTRLRPEATVTPELVTAVPEVTATIEGETGQPEVDDVWLRVQDAGKMIVGTSADYPPFEFYTADFEIDGFDAALIREIGQGLNLEVEIRNYAFAGLSNALETDQIDLAIAAISVTEERSGFVDFSNIYFVTEDAILATGDAQVTISTVDELAVFKVGVQKNSVQEEFLQDELVDTGKMPARNLHSYVEAGDAVRDLAEGFTDFVMLDLPPAELAAESGEFTIVGQGLNRQRLAIAMPKGASALQSNVNDALLDLQNDGRITELADFYMGLRPEEIIPVPTPDPSQPTPTPPPPPECVDDMVYVADLSFVDHNMTEPPILQPGEPFMKGWRVRNTGTCTWDNTNKLTYAGGNVPVARMGGTAVFVNGLVEPGQDYDFWVDLVAPLIPGTYQGLWELRNGANEPFGQRIWVGITVTALPTPTPVPTQTPAPGISITVDQTHITQGECVTFTWDVTDAKAVYFYSSGEPWQQNGVAGQGSSIQCPEQTTTYNLRVVHDDNSVEIRQITIYIEPVAGAPVITRFTVNPDTIYLGECVDITWTVEGEVSNVSLKRNDIVLWDDAPVSGTTQNCPTESGLSQYIIEATGPGGTSRLQRNVDVRQPEPTPPAATATSTATPPANAPPVIDSFAADPSQIEEGNCVLVSWSTSGGTELVQILRNGVLVLDNGPLTGSGPDCLNEAGPVTYRLESSNSVGQTTAREDTVTVTETEQPPGEIVITSFISSADEIAQGECVVLSWEWTGTEAAIGNLTRNGVLILSDPPPTGSQQDCPPQTGQTQYVLGVDPATGTGDQASLLVNVLEQQPTPAPTEVPTAEPSPGPSPKPTGTLTPEPTDAPTSEPTTTPTTEPTIVPTIVPTMEPSPVPTDDGGPIIGVTWQLVTLFAQPVLEGATITAVFSEDGSLTGSSGCNTYTSSYTIDGSSISILPPAVTQLICAEPEGIMTQEVGYLATLPTASDYIVSGGQLTIRTALDIPVLVYTSGG